MAFMAKSPRLYCAALPAQSDLPAQIALPAAVMAHIKALRLRPGCSLTLFDGQGCEYPAQLQSVDSAQAWAVVQPGCTVDRESPLQTHLGLGLSLGERMEYALQKAVELGVSCITPLQCQRSELKLSAQRAQKRHQRWQQIIISACEQCGRNRLPRLQPLQKLQPWLEAVEAEHKWLLHPRAAQVRGEAAAPRQVALLIGPEGGLTEYEVDLAVAQGFVCKTLGPRVLRTETAPLVALALLQSQWGDID